MSSHIYKFSSPIDYNFDINPVEIVRMGANLQKRAGARSLLNWEKTANQTDLHIIAVGAYEGTGYNRNMDMFKEADCKSNFHYFKDADRAVHRHHKNKKKDPKYGNIKAAAYNDNMRRIELIVGLDNDKCGDIIQEQEKRGNTNWSMASKQACDVCSWCKHRAASDEDRCEHIPDKLGEINKVGEMCGMENPDPRWFEISYVHRPADRIGMSLQKVAHTGIRPMSTKDYLSIYPGFTGPDDSLFISKKAADKRNILAKLAEIEKYLDAVSQGKDQRMSLPSEKIAEVELDSIRSMEPTRFFKLAAKKGIILSPENFVSYVFGGRIKEAAVAEIKTELAHIFQKLEKDAAVLNNEIYEPTNVDNFDKGELAIINKLAKEHSLFSFLAKERAVLGPITKTAAVDELDAQANKEIAKQYIAYKIAAINELGAQVTEDFLFNTVLQHR